MRPPEVALCEYHFTVGANLGVNVKPIDATHESVTIRQVTTTLQLGVTEWLPTNATQRLIEHEEGHRQIAEIAYQNADGVARRIAGAYIGRQVMITGANLEAELQSSVQQMAKEIDLEYQKEISPDAAEARYDVISDHGRSKVLASVSVIQVLAEFPPK